MKQLHPSMRSGLFMLIAYFAISLTVILACNRNKDIDAKPNVPQQASVSSPYTTAATCNCAGSNFDCPPCVKNFMGGVLHQTYSVTWSACVGPGGIDCMNWTSSIDFCISAGTSCDKICCVIHNPPPCLPCLTDGSVFELGANCDQSGNISFGVYESGISWDLIVNINGDPKINIVCRDNISLDEYQCSGHVTL